MSQRKLLSLAVARPGLARKQSARQKERDILARRDALLKQVTGLRENDGGAEFVDKAHALLTRLWSSASWKAREKLLESADWLVRIERHRASPA